MRKTGAIDYIELPGRNMSEVKRFYSAAFGWDFQSYGPHYCAFSGAGLDGGFQADGDEMHPHPLVILYAEDLAAAERKVEAAGGRVTIRHDFPGGRRFHFRDPAGNILAVWTDKV
ncbi:MAG: VOC family protein [Hyphomonadaceae bacterium]|nr:VOC family protein [Hyphomonadaceae bacterium]